MVNVDIRKFECIPGSHKGKNIIWVRFERNMEMMDWLKSNAKAYWSATNKSWYVTDNNHNRQLLGMEQNIIGKDALSRIHEVNIPALIRYQEQLKLKAYSVNTIRTYTIELAQLMYLLKSKSIDTLTPDQLRSYFLYCIDKLKLSESEIHSRINAIKFYFEQVLHRQKMFIDIPRPKKKQQLPKTLQKQEIKKIFDITDNPKHKLMLQLCYGLGLRVSEIVHLKIEDINSESMTVTIRQAKGKKDRVVMLPHTILDAMRAYYLQYKPKVYLFEGQSGGQYSIRSAQAVFKNAMNKAGIDKKIGVHGLRHSYATHLLEAGTDLRFIKELIGRKSINTREINKHTADISTSSIKSPLDQL